MSRRVLLLLVCLGNLSAMHVACGQGVTSPATAQHIVTINFSAAVMQTNEAKRDFGALETRYMPRRNQIESLSKEIDDLRKQLNDQKDKLSDSELNARTQTLATRQKQLERAEEDYRNDSQSDGEQAFRRIAQKVFEYLQTYAHERGYTMVIDRGTQDLPVVLYAAQDADITNEVISAYNAKAGIPAPTAGTNSRAPGASSMDAPRDVPQRP